MQYMFGIHGLQGLSHAWQIVPKCFFSPLSENFREHFYKCCEDAGENIPKITVFCFDTDAINCFLPQKKE